MRIGEAEGDVARSHAPRWLAMIDQCLPYPGAAASATGCCGWSCGCAPSATPSCARPAARLYERMHALVRRGIAAGARSASSTLRPRRAGRPGAGAVRRLRRAGAARRDADRVRARGRCGTSPPANSGLTEAWPPARFPESPFKFLRGRLDRVSPRPRLDHVRRPAILAAAAEVIRERGLEHTRVSDVAERVGTSAPVDPLLVRLQGRAAQRGADLGRGALLRGARRELTELDSARERLVRLDRRSASGRATTTPRCGSSCGRKALRDPELAATRARARRALARDDRRRSSATARSAASSGRPSRRSSPSLLSLAARRARGADRPQGCGRAPRTAPSS